VTIDSIDVEAAVKKVQQLLAEEVQLLPALRLPPDVLLLVVLLRDCRRAIGD